MSLFDEEGISQKVLNLKIIRMSSGQLASTGARGRERLVSQ